MKFTCDSCSAQYMISDEKVGPSGVKVRCKKCGTVIHVRRPAEDAAPAPAPAPAGGGGGLDVELGNAFDNAFGDSPPRAAAQAPAPDLSATQGMDAEDAARIAAGSAPAATEWYVAIGQAQVGPLPLAEVKRKWEGGEIGPDSLVWRPGMADWGPLSAVADLAGYLSPVPQAASRSTARHAEARPEAGAGRGGEAAALAADVSWKPVAASALAALASEEMASGGKPAQRTEPRPTGGVKSLVDALPEGGGVDPTGAIPLPIKVLESTGEKKLERRSSVARGAEEARRRSVSRAVLLGVTAVALLVAGTAALGVWYMNRQLDRVERAPIATAPSPAAAQPAAVQQPPAPAPTPPEAMAAATPPAPPAAAPIEKAPPAPAAEPAPKPAAEAPRAAEPPPSQKASPARTVRREPPRETRVSQASPAAPPAPAPTPEPAPRKRSGSVLDFESNDTALDEALGGGSSSSGRSVYVPPRPGGELPAKLSSAQINEGVAGRIDGLQRCVSEQKSRDADATGTLKMRWLINADGSVRDVKCLTPEYASGQFAQCLAGVVRSIKFPRSTTNGQEVTFPFRF
jgi:predicted Zn finger-like uncharacterized protein